jgi:hypothetical protein
MRREWSLMEPLAIELRRVRDELLEILADRAVYKSRMCGEYNRRLQNLVLIIGAVLSRERGRS